MKWRRRRIARGLAQVRKHECQECECRRLEKLGECWLPRLVEIGDGPNPCVDVRAESLSKDCSGIPLSKQSDFGVAMLLIRREIKVRGGSFNTNALLQITDQIRKFAAAEWLHRYPQGVQSSKWWVPSLRSVRLLLA